MWNEPSPNIKPSPFEERSTKHDLEPAIIESVEPDSIGQEVGFEAGDKILSINGIKPRDLIDYQYLITEEDLLLEVIDKKGSLHKIKLEKDSEDRLGLVFTEVLFDGLKQCNNKCPFCFIDQQPSGRRQTLYIKDDDYRMSFLYGSYLTLTNLVANDWVRIENQRLSPLFISVHATEAKLRSELLKNHRAGIIMEQIKWFADRKLQLHAQIVVCPGINDESHLENSLNDLSIYGKGEWPTILSTAIVPVGLTRFRPDQDKLKPVDKKCAAKVIKLVESMQENYQSKLGTRFAWLSDEWYLIAEQALPPRVKYGELPQEENGVGSIRSFLESMDHATRRLPKRISRTRKISWVVGKLVEHSLKPISERMNKIAGVSLQMIGLSSPYWGKENVVTGLLTGRDVIDGLQEKDLGDELLLPSIMLKHGESTFLDDITVEEVSNKLQVPITIVSGAEDFVKKLLRVKK